MTDTQLALVGSQSNWGTEINSGSQRLKPALGGDPEWGPPSAAPALLMVYVCSELGVLHLLTFFYDLIQERASKNLVMATLQVTREHFPIINGRMKFGLFWQL